MNLELLLIAAAIVPALAMAPWRTLRASGLQNPWLACLVLLPWLWAAQRALPGGVVLQMSGACLLVLMFGWPLAVLSLLPIAVAGAWIGGAGLAHAVGALAWNGVLPATLALAFGLATRRWLPHHLFVFILGRGFIVSALAIAAAGALSVWWQPLPPGTELEGLLLGHWLMAWGEAFVTGMFTAIFVAFKPEWLASWSDRRYLHRE
jgi:uncharacterized membrane protein